MSHAFRDIGQAFSRFNLWVRMSVTDMQQTYKRSIVGIAWIAFAFGLFVAVKALIFGSFAPGEPGLYMMWLTIGLWMFYFLQQLVVDGSNVFIQSRNWLLATDMPLTGFILRSIIRGVIKVIYQIPVVLFIIYISKWKIPLEGLWAIFGFIVILINAVWAQIFLGIVCTRFRDFAHLVQSIMGVMFFLTPILYFPSQVGAKAAILNWNPFTHYIAIVRDPMIYGTHPHLSWIVVGSLTVIGWIVAIVLLHFFRKRVVFWV